MKIKITRSEFLLTLLSIILTVIIALGLIRWIAPTLLGISADLVLVKSDKKVSPFYENVFLGDHYSSEEFILQDPIVRVRAKPMFPDIGALGPNDLLGFRNSAVPLAADVVVIGDSQTYGNNAVMWENWPHYLQASLPLGTNIYSMATGGWAALQYKYAFNIAPLFSPEVIVIAFYTGNDALETYTLAIASEYWKDLLPARDISEYGTPNVAFPAPESERWAVIFADGVKTSFTPKLRHSSNLKHPAIDAGYEIMHNVARDIARKAQQHKLNVIFTIIPTKEYVYSEKIKQSKIDIHPDYQALIDDENIRIKEFSALLEGLEGGKYVDVAGVLKKAAMHSVKLYPENSNGHPIAAGYNVIASAIAPEVEQYVNPIEDGYYNAESQSGVEKLIYIEDGKYWFMENIEQLRLNKKPEGINTKKLAGLLYAGHLSVKNND